MFENSSVNQDILKKRAYNLRWATVPEGVIPLTAADPDFPCAPEIAASIADYAKERYFSYGPPEGLPAFKESLAGYFRNKRKIAAKPESILPVDSAAFGIYITCKAFLSAGDEAIIFDPVDFLFRYSVETVGATAVAFAIPAGIVPDIDKLESLVTAKTKMICLCNPINPTGKVFTCAELSSIAAIAAKHNLVILSDEIWSDIVYPPYEYVSMASLDEDTRNRTVTVTGFSKSYGMAGLRIGAVMASGPGHFGRIMDASLHGATIHGANTVSQVAAATALDKCGYWLDGFLAHLHRMRDLCVGELNGMNGINCISPEGCYVAFANITRTGKTSTEMHELLLKKARVAVVPGLKQWFGSGAEGYIRISFATSEEILKDALLRMKNTIGSI